MMYLLFKDISRASAAIINEDGKVAISKCKFASRIRGIKYMAFAFLVHHLHIRDGELKVGKIYTSLP